MRSELELNCLVLAGGPSAQPVEQLHLHHVQFLQRYLLVLLSLGSSQVVVTRELDELHLKLLELFSVTFDFLILMLNIPAVINLSYPRLHLPHLLLKFQFQSLKTFFVSIVFNVFFLAYW